MIDFSFENGIATITLNRPEKLNAFAGTMRQDLLQALRKAGDDAACRVVVITGAGRAFSAGGDVEFMRGLQERRDAEAFGKLLDAGSSVVEQIVELPKPVIASINGVAAGAGCNLALACDYRMASENAKLGETFVRIGLHPDWGGTWLLPRLVGRSRAFELLATGRMIDAREAVSIGMIDRSAADLAAETHALASAIATAPAAVMADIKRALSRSSINDLRSQLALERQNQLRAFLSSEAAERIVAFLTKGSAR
ncbi:MAG TPA: enoyl-CoA hydratase-related protein [Thermoanaerobaculia bacterium]|nr:enoyl-CoA hydratase-related protein [Thermoanaerobaculia bacterium]